MAKERKKKVQSITTPNYTTSDDEGDSSDNEQNLSLLFKGLSFKIVDKINELVKFINEMNELLESQEDLLVRENEKFVKLKDALVHEKEKCKNLSDELKTCNDSISCLKSENVNSAVKVEELNACHASTYIVEHVFICTRCREVNIDAIDDHLALIKN
jgi:chromosome segregation ATPase